jgi:hypothetical protein
MGFMTNYHVEASIDPTSQMHIHTQYPAVIVYHQNFQSAEASRPRLSVVSEIPLPLLDADLDIDEGPVKAWLDAKERAGGGLRQFGW